MTPFVKALTAAYETRSMLATGMPSVRRLLALRSPKTGHSCYHGGCLAPFLKRRETLTHTPCLCTRRYLVVVLVYAEFGVP